MRGQPVVSTSTSRHRAETAILASLALRHQGAQGAVYVEGISSIARKIFAQLRAWLSRKTARRRGAEPRRHRAGACIRHGAKSSSIAAGDGVTNAVTIDGEGIPPITLVRPRRRRGGDRVAVVADIADLARGIRAKPFGGPVAKLRAIKKARWNATRAATTSA